VKPAASCCSCWAVQWSLGSSNKPFLQKPRTVPSLFPPQAAEEGLYSLKLRPLAT